jgi:hypothetical protein
MRFVLMPAKRVDRLAYFTQGCSHGSIRPLETCALVPEGWRYDREAPTHARPNTIFLRQSDYVVNQKISLL